MLIEHGFLSVIDHDGRVGLVNHGWPTDEISGLEQWPFINRTLDESLTVDINLASIYDRVIRTLPRKRRRRQLDTLTLDYQFQA